MPATPQPFDFAAAERTRFNARVDDVIAKGELNGHRIAIRNVERMIGQLGFNRSPSHLHVSDLLAGQSRLERSVEALSAKVAA